MKVHTAITASAGLICGSITDQKVFRYVQPSIFAASSSSLRKISSVLSRRAKPLCAADYRRWRKAVCLTWSRSLTATSSATPTPRSFVHARAIASLSKTRSTSAPTVAGMVWARVSCPSSPRSAHSEAVTAWSPAFAATMCRRSPCMPRLGFCPSECCPKPAESSVNG